MFLPNEKKHFATSFAFTLTAAVVEAADLLDLDAATLAAILQMEITNVQALRSGGDSLAAFRHIEWQRATDFVQLFCALDKMGAPSDCGRYWLREPHALLQARPVDVLLHHDGLSRLLALVLPERPLTMPVM